MIVPFAESDDDDDLASSGSDGAEEEGEFLTSQLASAGTTGMAAAAAISSTKRRKTCHSFETNPSVRRRQQTRLLRKLKVSLKSTQIFSKNDNLLNKSKGIPTTH